jgi:acyl carrier protein
MPTNEDILQQVLDILKPIVPKNVPEVTAELDLVNDLGLDSLKVMEILENLEDTFDISIPINILPGIRTVGDLVVEIQKLTEEEG